jgi:hypothetical protein
MTVVTNINSCILIIYIYAVIIISVRNIKAEMNWGKKILKMDRAFGL